MHLFGKEKKEKVAEIISRGKPEGGLNRWADEERPYVIHIKGVEKVYDAGSPRETHALQGVNLDISLGEIVILFGPSGSGKSTLVNIIAGLDKATDGEAVVGGLDLQKAGYKELIEYHQFKVGIVFQSYNLVPTLTVLQNVTMPARLAGFERKEYKARGEDLLKNFQLEKIMHRLPTEISGGQQQRVGIMRALMNRPSMIIADEPTGNLDSVNSNLIMDIFKKLNEETTTTMVIVSHDPSVFKIADRIVHVLDGKVIKQTILSKKARVDEKTIGVPVEYLLSDEQKQKLLEQLGAKTTHKESLKGSKKKQEPEVGRSSEAIQKEHAQAWKKQEEAMVLVKKAALERLKEKAKLHKANWVLEEKEMKELKNIALERVVVRRKKQWEDEEEEMKQLKVSALHRVRVKHENEQAEHTQEWALKEEEMEALKRLAIERIASKEEIRQKTWKKQEDEMVDIKKSALARLKRKAKEFEKQKKRVWHMHHRISTTRDSGSAFAELVKHRDALPAFEQHILAALMVILSPDQRDRLSDNQVSRLMELVTQRVQGELDYTAFYTKLDAPESEDGVGLYRQTAEHVASGIEMLMMLGSASV